MLGCSRHVSFWKCWFLEHGWRIQISHMCRLWNGTHWMALFENQIKLYSRSESETNCLNTLLWFKCIHNFSTLIIENIVSKECFVQKKWLKQQEIIIRDIHGDRDASFKWYQRLNFIYTTLLFYKILKLNTRMSHHEASNATIFFLFFFSHFSEMTWWSLSCSEERGGIECISVSYAMETLQGLVGCNWESMPLLQH